MFDHFSILCMKVLPILNQSPQLFQYFPVFCRISCWVLEGIELKGNMGTKWIKVTSKVGETARHGWRKILNPLLLIFLKIASKYLIILTISSQYPLFYTLWKDQKTKGFLIFPGGIKKNNGKKWFKMKTGYSLEYHELRTFLYQPFKRQLHKMVKHCQTIRQYWHLGYLYTSSMTVSSVIPCNSKFWHMVISRWPMVETEHL